MVERPRIGAALLAAGSSRRFGDRDKLAAMFKGRRLGEHAAGAIPTSRCERAWVITAAPAHECEPFWLSQGFVPVVNRDARQGMGTSVCLAARLAEEAGLDALLIALADMPLVPSQHFSALLDEISTAEGLVVSATGETRMPPAVFGKAHFAALSQLHGDRGAGSILALGEVAACPPDWLEDFDTPEDLRTYGQAG